MNSLMVGHLQSAISDQCTILGRWIKFRVDRLVAQPLQPPPHSVLDRWEPTPGNQSESHQAAEKLKLQLPSQPPPRLVAQKDNYEIEAQPVR